MTTSQDRNYIAVLSESYYLTVSGRGPHPRLRIDASGYWFWFLVLRFWCELLLHDFGFSAGWQVVGCVSWFVVSNSGFIVSKIRFADRGVRFRFTIWDVGLWSRLLIVCFWSFCLEF